MSEHDERLEVTILLDESSGNPPRRPFDMVGAAAFQGSYLDIEGRVRDVYEELTADGYLDGLRSYERFKADGFHGSNDTAEISTAFVRFLSRNRGFKSYVYFTDRTTRPDLSSDQMHAVLYRDLLRNLFQEFSSHRVRLIFEQNHKLDFQRIASEAAAISSGNIEYSVEIGVKRSPYAMAIADYAMAIFSRWRDIDYREDPDEKTFRSWCAIRRWVSIVRSIEDGALYRHGHPEVKRGEGRRNTTSELNARDSRTQDGTLSSQDQMVPRPLTLESSIQPGEFLRRVGMQSEFIATVGAAVSSGKMYQVRRIRKRRGGLRVIYSPSVELKSAQKRIRDELEKSLVYEDHPNVYGYIPGRSIFDNAQVHLGAAVVLRVDLRDFFASITSGRASRALLEHGASEELVKLLIPVLTADGLLPAGFPASPFLSNLVFRNTDDALAELSLSHGLAYTRYGDDLNFSGEIGRDDEFLRLVVALLESDGWVVNHRKTRFMRRGGPQYVTGLYVGDSAPRAPRGVKRSIRAQAHFVGLHGFDEIARERGGRVGSPLKLGGWIGYLKGFESRVAADAVERSGFGRLGAAREGRAGFDPSGGGWDEYLSRGVVKGGRRRSGRPGGAN
ncbi:reverse transcriptase family protein [Cellulosimicrobium funkei]|uniref:reverse transcriptase family protein n=1 Tax=Cellulosimicrobium funkei TaxID=264251 RepID=UPI0020414EE2|nr:reverse transcriptase family protein [Cellulosimicrobium funkei]MCM3533988.1 reverse transcriptase family protein [Cellulosimicrobium funkei]